LKKMTHSNAEKKEEARQLSNFFKIR